MTNRQAFLKKDYIFTIVCKKLQKTYLQSPSGCYLSTYISPPVKMLLNLLKSINKRKQTEHVHHNTILLQEHFLIYSGFSMMKLR